MKPRNLKTLVSSLALFAAQSALADSIHIDVKGMVCSFCAQGITKKFQAEPAVASVNVNLEKHFVHLETKSALSDERIRQVITDAGYTISSIERK
jgi:periplasmic mercuric ion binding protein